MFEKVSGRRNRKKRRKTAENRPSAAAPAMPEVGDLPAVEASAAAASDLTPPPPAVEGLGGGLVGATAGEPGPDPELDSLTIEDYAKKHTITEAEVWRRMRRGELLGRTEHGRLLIYEGGIAAVQAMANDHAPNLGNHEPVVGAKQLAEAVDLGGLPPLPEQEVAAQRVGASAGFLTLSGERTAATPEMALLLDHLSLAKEENREILKLTQESIRRVTEMSNSLVEMKDTVIEAKEAQVMALREQLAARDDELRKLKQQCEDLEMLARTVVSSK